MLYSFSTHRARLGVPDLRCVFPDGAVAGKAVRASYIDNRFAGPTIRVRIKLSDLALSLQIRFEVGQMHIVVAVIQERVPDRAKDPRLVAAKVVVKNKIEGFAGLRLIPVVPERIVPAA